VSKSRYAWVKGDRDTRIRLAPFEPPAFRFLPILNMGVRLLSPRPSVLQAVPKGGRETSRRCWPLKPLRIRDLKSFRCSARCPAPSPKRYRSSLREGTVGMVSSSYDNALSSAWSPIDRSWTTDKRWSRSGSGPATAWRPANGSAAAKSAQRRWGQPPARDGGLTKSLKSLRQAAKKPAPFPIRKPWRIEHWTGCAINQAGAIV